MNKNLKREIVIHILKTVGVLADEDIMRISMMEKINDEKFLLDKKIAFEGDGKVKENNLWAACTKIDASNIKIMVADITEDITEFALILQMDTFLPCAIRLSADQEDSGSMLVSIDNNRWVDATTHFQAKMLVGFEGLSETYLVWEKLDDYMDMYKSMVGFLNYCEQD